MSVVAARQVTTFSALRGREFCVFWIGFLISMIGLWMQTFALGWLVVQLAERDGVPERAALYIGFVGLSRALPAIVFGLVAGVVVDRVDRRFLLVVSQTCALVATAVLAALTLAGAVTVGWVLALSAIGSATGSFEVIARQTIIPRLVGPEHLASAVGLNGTAANVSALLGPLLGGLLIGPLGIGGLMVLNAVSYLAVLASLAFIPAQPSVASGTRGGMFASIGEGLAYVRDTPLVRWQLLLFGVGILLGRPYVQLLPAFVHDTLHLGATELSWLAAAGATGGLAATLVAASLGRARRRGLVFIVSSLGGGLSLTLLGVQRSLAPAIALMVVVGFTMVLAATLTMMSTQLMTPDHLRGRVISVQTLIFQSGLSTGTLLLGALGTAVGIDVAIAVGGAALALTSVLVLARAPELRHVADLPRPPANTDAAPEWVADR